MLGCSSHSLCPQTGPDQAIKKYRIDGLPGLPCA